MRFIFALRITGAIAHPDSRWLSGYREVEHRTENPGVPVPIAIGTIPGDNIGLLYSLYFMQYCCYIIFSKSINKFYVGYTSDVGVRLNLHNTGCFGNKSFTSRASDWCIFLTIPCETIEMARHIELHIKKMKSRKYIENLGRHPEMIMKILSRFRS